MKKSGLSVICFSVYPVLYASSCLCLKTFPLAIKTVAYFSSKPNMLVFSPPHLLPFLVKDSMVNLESFACLWIRHFLDLFSFILCVLVFGLLICTIYMSGIYGNQKRCMDPLELALWTVVTQAFQKTNQSSQILIRGLFWMMIKAYFPFHKILENITGSSAHLWC